MSKILDFIKEESVGDLFSWSNQIAAMEQFDLSCAEVEKQILTAGYLPTRYQRNRNMLSIDQQLHLFTSKVAVVGCGGLGGYILEELARLGIGQLVAIDPDLFEEHNLNRQLLSTLDDLGRSKAEAAVQRLAGINPAVSVQAQPTAFAKENAAGLFNGVALVADAVDSVPVRLELAEACNELNLPLVHGAIAGWYGQVATVFPGEQTIQKIYHRWTSGRGAEAHLGSPAFTPAAVASFQVAEICKVLLGTGTPLRNRKLSINLLDMSVEEIEL